MKSNRVKLRKLKNTRDLGGLKTTDGKTVRCGKLLRSGKLSKLPAKTLLALEGRIDTVIDLRIENERISSPDVLPQGCRYVHLPLLCVPTLGITTEYDPFTATEKETARVRREGERIKREFGSIDRYMKETYRSIVFSPEGQEGLKKFLRIIIEEEGCVLWHCASGKDRAGICAMLVEGLLGVDRKHILEDYMLSGRYWRKRYFLNRCVIAIVPANLSLKRMLFGFMRTKRDYLEGVLDEIGERYGDIAGFCKACLGVTDGDILRMKAKYLV